MAKTLQPKISFLVPSPHGYIPLDASTARTPMRLTRHGEVPGDDPPLNYGQYFRTVSRVISRDAYILLVEATGRQLGHHLSLAGVGEVLICAEKHGSDYHPARIEVLCGERRATFVMNVAVTTRGKARLSHEFDVLQNLAGKYGYPFLPYPHYQGRISIGAEPHSETDTSALMFLADWFQRYHEFHLSIDQEDQSQKLVLWDTEKGPWHLSRKQSIAVYRQAAFILTVYYDVQTFEQIFPWHHGAGDFVVKAEGNALDVKLVTARQYAPMIDPDHDMPPREALLFFLLNLSLRMRLDRIDGTGKVAWAESPCVDATLKGFMEGLREKECCGTTDAGFVNTFLRYCSALSKKDLSERFHALVDACDPSAPDMPVIRPHLAEHICKFCSVFQGAFAKSLL